MSFCTRFKYHLLVKVKNSLISLNWNPLILFSVLVFAPFSSTSKESSTQFMFRFYRKQKFKRLQNTLMLAFLVLSITPVTLIAIFFLQSHSQDLQNKAPHTLFRSVILSNSKLSITCKLKNPKSWALFAQNWPMPVADAFMV